MQNAPFEEFCLARRGIDASPRDVVSSRVYIGFQAEPQRPGRLSYCFWDYSPGRLGSDRRRSGPQLSADFPRSFKAMARNVRGPRSKLMNS